MNISSLSIGQTSYQASLTSSSGLSQVADATLQTASVAPTADLLDLSSAGMLAADEISLYEAELFSETPTDEILRDQLTALWGANALVAKYLQLGGSSASDDSIYARMFEVTIRLAETEIEDRISALLEEAGIELAEGERFDIHIDAEGQISVTLLDADGKENEEKAQAIADALNADMADTTDETNTDTEETLAHAMLRLKALKNTRDSLLGFEKDGKSHLLGQDSYGTSMMPDLDTRKFLVEDYLQREFGLSLDADGWTELLSLKVAEAEKAVNVENGTEADDSEKADRAASLELLEKVQAEVATVLKNDTTGEEKEGLTADYSFGDGVLLDTEETSDASIQNKLDVIYSGDGLANHPQNGVDSIAEAMIAYNSTAAEERKISDFSIVVNEHGGMRIEGQFTSGDDLGSAKTMIESWISPTLESLIKVTTDTILKKHDAEHHDVDEYSHQVELQVDLVKGITAEIQSEEADRAALADIAKNTIAIVVAFEGYAKETSRENGAELGTLLQQLQQNMARLHDPP